MPWIRKVETTSKNPMNSTEWAMNYQNDLSARGKHQIVLCGCWQVRVRLITGGGKVDLTQRRVHPLPRKIFFAAMMMRNIDQSDEDPSGIWEFAR